MKKLLKSNLLRILSRTNEFPTPMTEPNDLKSLLKKLYPLATDKELIRLGPKGDGGYLVPNDLKEIEACFSPGVSFLSGFEKGCADLGMKVFLADKSVDKPSTNHELFSFTKKFVGALSNEDFMTFDNWVASALPRTNTDLLLQIDIEGYEYEVFLSTSEELLQRTRIIIAEFHQLDKLWSKPFFNLARDTFEKILQTHSCVHIHPNNDAGYLQINDLSIPRIMEFTFLRNDRIKYSSYQKNFPNIHDYDNSRKPSLTLPKCWYYNK
jgi:hypothetical protein